VSEGKGEERRGEERRRGGWMEVAEVCGYVDMAVELQPTKLKL